MSPCPCDQWVSPSAGLVLLVVVALWKTITGQAAAGPGPPLAPEPFHSPAYNISLNFSSIIAFPSRLLARIRKADDYLFPDVFSGIPSVSDAKAATAAKSSQLSGRGGTDFSGPMWPGPYGFFLSGYMLGLLALAVLMHRIQNIVVPPRFPSPQHPTARTPGHARRFYGYQAVCRLYASILPLDLTRTTTRLAFHLPTLYFLCRMLLVWSIVLLQTSDLFPAWELGYVQSLGLWTQRLEMQDVCWWTFCSICAAFAIEAFVRGLDGGGLAMIQMNTNASPFNLIGYAFLLHIYASPITHVYKPPSLPSRPDKHVIVTITIPLLQLTIFHILSIRKRWSNHRLLPTALSSFLSLLHFHMTLYSHYFSRRASPPLPPKIAHPPQSTVAGKFPAPTPPPTGPILSQQSSPLYSRPTGSASFPLLNYVPNTFETLLLLTIALTVVLNALTQLILTGRVSRPLLGLGLSGSSANGAWAWALPYEEDWGVVLLRVGTASLEATGLRGWGNEMPAVSAGAALQHEQQRFPEYGAARLGPNGIVHVSSGFGSGGAGRRYRRRGLKNEVREVDVGAQVYARAFGADLVNLRWIKEAWHFLTVVWGVGRGLVGGVWRYIRSGRKAWGGRDRAVSLRPARDITPSQVEVVEEEEGEDEDDQDEALYGRFLRQEEISDDENDSAAQVWDLAGNSESEDNQEQDEQDQELDDHETAGIYADLAGTTPAPVLLAHMTRDGESPLTRRRYGTLVGSWPRQSELPVLLPRPISRPASQPLDETRRNCVICTSEARDIICWPCRCLSMCDGCREVLASRSSASKHRCPCCRQAVQGFSRIFIP
ncbi:hypothetical protein GGX14DRAFT_697227 [Mycena pura]|uniref:RING-type domain-containing protein n=1 Tax=Mycena pura TaxID=153505 RepID=A0AAD6YIH9_9AGAR|nr:hypothetical protein GGX14DRAFT_697227 [Mycena pura]